MADGAMQLTEEQWLRGVQAFLDLCADAWRQNDFDLLATSFSEDVQVQMHRAIGGESYVGRAAFYETTWSLREFFPVMEVTNLGTRQFAPTGAAGTAISRLRLVDDAGNEIVVYIVAQGTMSDPKGSVGPHMLVDLGDGLSAAADFHRLGVYDTDREAQAWADYHGSPA